MEDGDRRMEPPLMVHARLVLGRALADVRNRYTSSIMGIWWNVLHPIALILIFAVVFSRLIATRVPGLDGVFSYPLFLCAGLFPWLAFSEAIVQGAGVLQRNASYIRKMAVPEYIFFAEISLSSTITLLTNFAVFLVLATLAALSPKVTWILLPIPFLFIIIQAFCLAMIVGVLNVYIRDVGVAVPLVLQLAMWLAPVVYPPGVVPEFFRPLLFVNPITPSLNMVRGLVLSGETPQIVDLLAASLWSLALIAAAWLVWTRLRAELRDLL